MLWIYVPNYTYNGTITAIQNVTNWETEHQNFWDSLDFVKRSYPTNETWQATTKERCYDITGTTYDDSLDPIDLEKTLDVI